MPVYSQDLRKRGHRHQSSVETARCARSPSGSWSAFRSSFDSCDTIARRVPWNPNRMEEDGSPRWSPAQLKRLAALIRKKPDATLVAIAPELGGRCSTMAIVRALKKLKITRKEEGPSCPRAGFP